MRIVKNFSKLATTYERKICLELIEAALSSIQPEKIIQKNIFLEKDTLSIQDISVNLGNYDRIFLIAFGKGAGGLSYYTSKILEPFLTKGYVIDLIPEIRLNNSIEYSIGTHPFPSETNFLFTRKVINRLRPLTQKDLVVVIVAGGGSALFVHPYKITLEKLIKVNKILLRSGANISEIVTVRKHLDIVKGGGLTKLLYPARLITMIVSDVPGDDLSTIASGPTVKDLSTKEQAFDVLIKYNLWNKLNLSKEKFLETPKDDNYFNNVSNFLALSNQTALDAMQHKAKRLGFNAIIFSSKFQSEAKIAGKILIKNTPPHTVLLAGGETTVKVTGKGLGGRNQEVVLGALRYLDNNTLITSFGSDGWDNSPLCGAIGDKETINKMLTQNLNVEKYLKDNNSFEFFSEIGDGIITHKLPSNVSDLMIVMKN